MTQFAQNFFSTFPLHLRTRDHDGARNRSEEELSWKNEREEEEGGRRGREELETGRGRGQRREGGGGEGRERRKKRTNRDFYYLYYTSTFCRAFFSFYQ